MHQRDVERFAFLYLCGTKDRHILLGKDKITFMDFDRLTYLTDFFGLEDYNLDIWNQFVGQFKNQFEALIKMYEETNLECSQELDLGENDAECQLHDMWVRDFCNHAPNKELRLWLGEQVAEIYKEQGMVPFDVGGTP